MIEYNKHVKLVLAEGAVAPILGDQMAAGWDLHANEGSVLKSRSRTLIKTGAFMEIPDGYYGKIFSRSGLSYKFGIEAGAGVIDSSFRGEIGVVLYNHSDIDFEIKRGDRIAQIVFMPYMEFPLRTVESLGNSERGKNGFGSTGI